MDLLLPSEREHDVSRGGPNGRRPEAVIFFAPTHLLGRIQHPTVLGHLIDRFIDGPCVTSAGAKGAAYLYGLVLEYGFSFPFPPEQSHGRHLLCQLLTSQ